MKTQKPPRTAMQFHARVCAALVFSLLLSAGAALGAGPLLDHVAHNPGIVTPEQGVEISYYLSEDARVSAVIYSSDFDPVRHLLSLHPRAKGVNTVRWDGRDDGGTMVPNEAYLYEIRALDSSGKEVFYNPAKTGDGGKSLNISLDGIEKSGPEHKIVYTLAVPARVSMMAGIHKGPLLKTVLDWIPKPAGRHEQAWNGLDATGQISVMDQPGSHIYMKGFVLPKNVLIVQSSSGDYLTYRKKFDLDALQNERSDALQTVRRSTLEQNTKDLSPLYLVQNQLNVSPEFAVYLAPDTSTEMAQRGVVEVSDTINLIIQIKPESLGAFFESRYEIVMFIDNERFDEEEQADSPYNYALNTRRLVNGEHTITINQVSMNGQIGAYSFKINVSNKGE